MPSLNRRTFLKAAGAAGSYGVAAYGAGIMRPKAHGRTPITLGQYTVSPKWNADFLRSIQTFNDSQKTIKLTADLRPGTNYQTKLETDFAAGIGPDLSACNANWVQGAVARGMFVDLTERMKASHISASQYWYPLDLEWAYKGKTYGVFIYCSSMTATYVNKTLLKAAGLSMPSAGWTWDDLVQYGQKLTNKPTNQWGVYFESMALNDGPVGAFIAANGGRILTKNLKSSALGSSHVKSALTYVVDLISTHQVMPNPATISSSQENPFLTGKVGIFFGGTWNEPQVRAGGFDWDYAPAPICPATKRAGVVYDSNAWVMLSLSKHKDAAWEVMKYLAGPQAEKALQSDGIPCLKSLVGTAGFTKAHEPQNISQAVNDMKKWGVGDYLYSNNSAQWSNDVLQQMSTVWSGETSLGKGLSAASAVLDKDLQQPAS